MRNTYLTKIKQLRQYNKTLRYKMSDINYMLLIDVNEDCESSPKHINEMTVYQIKHKH